MNSDINSKNPYQVIGVAPNSTQREIKAAYTKLIKQYKPEHYPEEFRIIRNAYESILNNVEFVFAIESEQEPRIDVDPDFRPNNTTHESMEPDIGLADPRGQGDESDSAPQVRIEENEHIQSYLEFRGKNLDKAYAFLEKAVIEEVQCAEWISVTLEAQELRDLCLREGFSWKHLNQQDHVPGIARLLESRWKSQIVFGIPGDVIPEIREVLSARTSIEIYSVILTVIAMLTWDYPKETEEFYNAMILKTGSHVLDRIEDQYCHRVLQSKDWKLFLKCNPPLRMMNLIKYGSLVEPEITLRLYRLFLDEAKNDTRRYTSAVQAMRKNGISVFYLEALDCISVDLFEIWNWETCDHRKIQISLESLNKKLDSSRLDGFLGTMTIALIILCIAMFFQGLWPGLITFAGAFIFVVTVMLMQLSITYRRKVRPALIGFIMAHHCSFGDLFEHLKDKQPKYKNIMNYESSIKEDPCYLELDGVSILRKEED